MQVWSLGREDPVEEKMATHFNILAWRIPLTEEPGGGYSPWSRGESDTTEWLSMHVQYLLCAKNLQYLFAKCFACMNSLIWRCTTSRR